MNGENICKHVDKERKVSLGGGLKLKRRCLEMKLSDKAKKFLKRIEKETGREIIVERKSKSEMGGFPAYFEPDRKNFVIQIREDIEEDTESFQNMIIHEAIHGLLIYAKGYYHPEPKSASINELKLILVLLASLVDDIVVHRITHDEGFKINWDEYLRMVKIEIKVARGGKEMYKTVSSDPLVRSKFKVLRYVVAWGCLKYLKLRPKPKRILKRFLKAFEERYLDEFKMAKKIIEVITQNNIFTKDGQKEVIRQIWRLWDLEESTELKYYS